MRSLLIPGILSVALAVNGCALVGDLTGGTPITPNIVVSDVQKDAVSFCSFLPTADTVAAIIAAGNPGLATADAIAHAVCAAVTAKSARRIAEAPTVSGVVIKGQFLR